MEPSDDIERELEQISRNGIVNYEYIIQISEMVNRKGKTYASKMHELLANNPIHSTTDERMKNILFTAFYALGYYYKRYDKVELLD